MLLSWNISRAYSASVCSKGKKSQIANNSRVMSKPLTIYVIYATPFRYNGIIFLHRSSNVTCIPCGDVLENVLDEMAPYQTNIKIICIFSQQITVNLSKETALWLLLYFLFLFLPLLHIDTFSVFKKFITITLSNWLKCNSIS